MLLSNGRSLISLTNAQTTELASAILVLDHHLKEAHNQAIAMLAAENTQVGDQSKKLLEREEKVQVVFSPRQSGKINSLLADLSQAAQAYDDARYGDDENAKRLAFEKAAWALANQCKT